MDIFNADDYRDFVRFQIYGERIDSKPRGVVSRLADFLRCHTTHISHVTGKKAHFSHDQGLRFCQYFTLNIIETETFMDSICRDRAGNTETQQFYANRIKEYQQSQSALSSNIKNRRILDATQQAEYYATWIPQAVHMAATIPSLNTAEKIARYLRIGLRSVETALHLLVNIGLLSYDEGKVCAQEQSLHLPHNSPLYYHGQLNWLMKTATQISEHPESQSLHYCAVVSADNKAFDNVRQSAMRHVADTRNIIEAAESDNLYVQIYNLYPLGKRKD